MFESIVLVIDRDPCVRAQCEQVLRDECQVHTVASIAEGQKFLLTAVPTTIVMDIDEGEVEDAAVFIRNIGRDVAISVLTRQPFTDAEECVLLEAGAYSVVRKPVSDRKMELMLRRMAELYHVRTTYVDIMQRLNSIQASTNQAVARLRAVVGKQ